MRRCWAAIFLLWISIALAGCSGVGDIGDIVQSVGQVLAGVGLIAGGSEGQKLLNAGMGISLIAGGIRSISEGSERWQATPESDGSVPGETRVTAAGADPFESGSSSDQTSRDDGVRVSIPEIQEEPASSPIESSGSLRRPKGSGDDAWQDSTTFYATVLAGFERARTHPSATNADRAAIDTMETKLREMYQSCVVKQDVSLWSAWEKCAQETTQRLGVILERQREDEEVAKMERATAQYQRIDQELVSIAFDSTSAAKRTMAQQVRTKLARVYAEAMKSRSWDPFQRALQEATAFLKEASSAK